MIACLLAPRCLALAVLFFGSSVAHAASLGDGTALQAAAASLRPGEFVLDRAAATDGALAIVVSIALQRMYVYRGNVLVGVSTVSTGMTGRDTPRGDFQILQKARWHRSNLYSNASMPFMQRLTWDGIAIHAGWNPGYPASHGCVRLPTAFAKALFALTTLGAPVSVTDYPLQAPVYLRVEGLDWGDDVVMGGRTASIAEAQPHWAAEDDISAVRSESIKLDYSPAVFGYE